MGGEWGFTVSQAKAQLAGMSPGIMAATQITGYDARRSAQYGDFRFSALPASTGVSQRRAAAAGLAQVRFGTVALNQRGLCHFAG